MEGSCSNLSKWAIASLFLSLLWSCQPEQKEEVQATGPEEILAPEEASGKFPYRRLSTYGFFDGDIAQLSPSEAVIPYQPASSLFTDYALKSRFAYLPEGEKAVIAGEELNLPQGTILIKNFYYPSDFRNPEGERRIIETRLMIHEEDGWQAYPYVWNESQTDAVLKVVGDEKEVRFINQAGEEQVINYLVPNKNQCKSCHNKNESLAPLGVQTRHLNHDYDYGSGTENQLAHWTKLGKLVGFEGRTAHHGHHAVVDGGLANALDQLLFGEFAIFEEGIDQVFVRFRNRFHQFEAPFRGLFLHVIGDLPFDDVGAKVVGVDDRLVTHQVDDPLELTFSANRELDRGGIGLEAILDLFVDLEEVGAGAVHLVDEHHAGNAVAIRLAPDGF